MNTQQMLRFCEQTWDASIVPALTEYIAIPALSPLFDPEWKKHGHLDAAARLIQGWCGDQGIADMTSEIVTLEGRSPLLYLEIPGQSDDTVVLYGHFDKQPPMTGWREDLGPWKPVLEGDRLYGRGGADDGYAAFASLTAIRALREQNLPHARCVILIEGSEESGSPDLPAYIDHLADRIGTPSLLVCLDSGAGNYDQLWLTTSLRGIVVGSLHVDVLTEGVHSGAASGIVPSSFRIARQLLARIEDIETGEVHVDAFRTEIPAQRVEQVRAMAEILGDRVFTDFPVLSGLRPVREDPAELILNNTWRPALSVVGADGFPALETAGNVLRAGTALKLSLRLPPRVDAASAARTLKETLEADPPYGATVRFDIEGPGTGWNAPELAPWLETAIDRASRDFFGAPAAYMGEGGSIPFMAMLGEKFPETQFMITGVLGPHSNAHGPNEFLHVPTGKRLTAAVAHVLHTHYTERSGS